MPWETESYQEVGDLQFPRLWDEPQNYPVYDVDGYNITILPRDLLKIFGYFTSVQLSSHAPMVRDLPYYKDWVFIGSGPALLKVHPRYKVPLLEQLKLDNYLVYPSDFPRTLIHGSQVVSMYELYVNLVGSYCPAVRVQAYGMKTEVMEVLPTLGDPEHPLAVTNFFDVGRHFKQPHITLVKLVQPSLGTSNQYPMLLNIGRGYGSVKMETRFRGTLFKIKIYPRLVHCLKATSGKGTLFDPTTLQTCRRRESNFINRLEKLGTFPDLDLGGLRVEVTCYAHTLQEAKEKVGSTPLLNLHEYLHPTSEEMEKLKVDVRFVTKERYLANCRKLLDKAQELRVFRGKGTQKALKVRKNIIYDLFLGLGWNPGTRSTLWNLGQSSWWTWLPSSKDIDEPEELQPTHGLKFKDPLSVEVHLAEIERCVRMYKRGTMWRATSYNEQRVKVPFGSETTKTKLAQAIWQRFKFDWTKQCYLLEEPFKGGLGSGEGTSQVPRKLDEDLDKYQIKGTHMVPEGTKFTELQGTSNYRITSGYIKGDGNCQFRVLANLVFGSQNYHARIRRMVVEYLAQNRDIVEAVIAAQELPRSAFRVGSEVRDVPTYLTRMGNLGTWGDDATLSAAVTIFQLSLVIINPDRSYFEVTRVPSPAQWHALYYTGNHYELVYKQSRFN